MTQQHKIIIPTNVFTGAVFEHISANRCEIHPFVRNVTLAGRYEI